MAKRLNGKAAASKSSIAARESINAIRDVGQTQAAAKRVPEKYRGQKNVLAQVSPTKELEEQALEVLKLLGIE